MDLSELVFFPLKMAMSDPRNQIGKWWGVSRMETEDDMDVTQWYSYVLPDIYFMATFMDLLHLLPGVSWIFHGFTSCFQDFHGFGPQFFPTFGSESEAPLAARVRGAPAACHGARPARGRHRGPPRGDP